ncbi:MAG: hypothetical protein HYV52_01345 [Parcubacteria group bacterium]|nr:hypothetical protein [Parcubacteria group bacterium]
MKNPIIYFKTANLKNLIYPAVSFLIIVFLVGSFYLVIKFLSLSLDNAFKTDPLLIQREAVKFKIKEIQPIIEKLKINI